MRTIVRHLKEYVLWLDKNVFFLSVLFTAAIIFCNYYFDINGKVTKLTYIKEYASWYFIFILSFSLAYFFTQVFKNSGLFRNKKFLLFLAIAPGIFSWKMSSSIYFEFTKNEDTNAYLNSIAYWPCKLFIIGILLFAVWKIFERDQPFYGVSITHFSVKPYVIMLLCMLPLIAAASTQPDFLLMYPKVKALGQYPAKHDIIVYQLLYELSYGSDFLGIELFFRGFLILGFAKWAGKDTILPMAMFYCTIHFGKPLGECISSFFGGIILGVVTFHSRTIWGGLIVHLGIAWLMEAGGYLGNMYWK